MRKTAKKRTMSPAARERISAGLRKSWRRRKRIIAAAAKNVKTIRTTRKRMNG